MFLHLLFAPLHLLSLTHSHSISCFRPVSILLALVRSRINILFVFMRAFLCIYYYYYYWISERVGTIFRDSFWFLIFFPFHFRIEWRPESTLLLSVVPATGIAYHWHGVDSFSPHSFFLSLFFITNLVLDLMLFWLLLSSGGSGPLKRRFQ